MTMKRVDDFCVGMHGGGAGLRMQDTTDYILFVDHKGRLYLRKPYDTYVTDGFWVSRDRSNGSDHRNMSWWETKLYNWFGIIPEFDR